MDLVRLRLGLSLAGCLAACAHDDAPGAPDGGGASCLQLAPGTSPEALRARVDALVQRLHDAGASGANADVGPEAGYIRGFAVDLDTSSRTPDRAALAALIGLDASFREDELESPPRSDWQAIDSAVVSYARVRVAGRETRFWSPALTLLVLREAGSWRLRSITVRSSEAFATTAEVDALRACTPGQPPAEDGIRAEVFTGHRFRGCAMTGMYTYNVHPTDSITWKPGVTWQVRDEDGRVTWKPMRWRILQSATLTIDPANYWDTINEADCLCGDRAGYELEVDVISGEVVRYTPGINCVVC